VTPTHKEILDLKEQSRILKTLSVYSDREHFFLVPDNLDTRKLRKQFNQSVIVTMPNWFFRTIDHYNIMMLQPKLYTIFQQFEFILLCQPDAFLINKMNSLFKEEYDYFGASWPRPYLLSEHLGQLLVNRRQWRYGKHTTVSAGNGGLSLRRVSASIEIIKLGRTKPYWYKIERVRKRKINEDLVFSFLGKQLGFRVPEKAEAEKYFVETNDFDPKRLGELIGFHALEKYQPEKERLLFKELGM
jgi:hypothetical protein